MLMFKERFFRATVMRERERGKLYARVLREGIPGVSKGDIIEITKCVYGSWMHPFNGGNASLPFWSGLVSNKVNWILVAFTIFTNGFFMGLLLCMLMTWS